MAMTEEEKQEKLALKAEQDARDSAKAFKVLNSHNNVFEKDYNIKELDLEFSVSFRVPNLQENARIEADLQRMFGGFINLTSQSTQDAYHMYVLLNMQAEQYKDDPKVNIPKFLIGEDVYSLLPYAIIAEDYGKFLEQFKR